MCVIWATDEITCLGKMPSPNVGGPLSWYMDGSSVIYSNTSACAALSWRFCVGNFGVKRELLQHDFGFFSPNLMVQKCSESLAEKGTLKWINSLTTRDTCLLVELTQATESGPFEDVSQYLLFEKRGFWVAMFVHHSPVVLLSWCSPGPGKISI